MAVEINIIGLTLLLGGAGNICLFCTRRATDIYGLIEERRILGLLGVFPVLYLAMTKSISSEDATRFYVFTSDGSRVTPGGKGTNQRRSRSDGNENK